MTRARWFAVAAVLAAVGAGAVLGVRWLDRPPAGPVEPVWDRDRCAHCRMMVSDPRFASEIQTTDGRVLFFDDPGCLLAYEREHHVGERAVYFHHVREERWLARAAAGFVSTSGTPMNWGLAAVDIAEAGAVSAAAASAALPRPAPPEVSHDHR